jgi:hypothetical protein
MIPGNALGELALAGSIGYDELAQPHTWLGIPVAVPTHFYGAASHGDFACPRKAI